MSVYFITDGRYVKVGSAIGISARVARLQTGNPKKLEVIAVCAGGAKLEKRLHRSLRQSAHGEWFHRTPELETLLKDLAGADHDEGERIVIRFIEGAERRREERVRLAKAAHRETRKAFLHNLSGFTKWICEKHGASAVAAAAKVSTRSLRLWGAGRVVPSMPAIIALGELEPTAVDGLLMNSLLPRRHVEPKTAAERFDELQADLASLRRELGA